MTAPIHSSQVSSDLHLITSMDSAYVTEAKERQVPISCEIVYSSKHEHQGPPAVGFWWVHNGTGIQPAFLTESVAADAAKWGIPPTLYDELVSRLRKTAGTCLYMLPPRNTDPTRATTTSSPGAMYYELTAQLVHGLTKAALRRLQAWMERWVAPGPLFSDAPLLCLEHALQEKDLRGLIISWNTCCHRIVGTDLYFVFQGRQREHIRSLIERFCPAAERDVLSHVLDLEFFIEDPRHPKVFVKVADDGAFSMQCECLPWTLMRALETQFAPHGVISRIRRRYENPPNIFSMGCSRMHPRYCTAYVLKSCLRL